MRRVVLWAVAAVAMGVWADVTVRTVTSKDGVEPTDYVPAMLSNGRLNVFMDYRLGIAPGSKALQKKRLSPGIFWEGRRLVDNTGVASRFGYQLLPQGSFRTRLVVDGREQSTPTAWTQSLDLRRALTTTEGTYAGGVKLMGEAFVAKRRNVVAVRQTVVNGAAEPRAGGAFHQFRCRGRRGSVFSSQFPHFSQRVRFVAIPSLLGLGLFGIF